MNLAMQSIISFNQQTNRRLDDALTGRRRIHVRHEPSVYARNEDGEFHCLHEAVEITYDQGGDGRTEPGPSYNVYCLDCRNDDLEQWQIDPIITNYSPEQETE